MVKSVATNDKVAQEIMGIKVSGEPEGLWAARGEIVLQIDDTLTGIKPCTWGQKLKDGKCEECPMWQFTILPQSTECYKCKNHKHFKKEPLGSAEREVYLRFCDKAFATAEDVAK